MNFIRQNDRSSTTNCKDLCRVVFIWGIRWGTGLRRRVQITCGESVSYHSGMRHQLITKRDRIEQSNCHKIVLFGKYTDKCVHLIKKKKFFFLTYIVKSKYWYESKVSINFLRLLFKTTFLLISLRIRSKTYRFKVNFDLLTY